MNELQFDQLITRAGWIVDGLRDVASALNNISLVLTFGFLGVVIAIVSRR